MAGDNAPQYHFKLRVGNDPSHDWDRGWVKETKGEYPAVGEALSPIPYWITPNNHLERCSSTPSSTSFRSKATRSPPVINRIICRDETGAEIYRDSSYEYCFEYYSRNTVFLRDMLKFSDIDVTASIDIKYNSNLAHITTKNLVDSPIQTRAPELMLRSLWIEDVTQSASLVIE